MPGTVLWLRQDLRLADHPALTAAAKRGPVVPVYVWAPHEEGDHPPGAASRWWLHHSLVALDTALREAGSRLVLRCGDSLAELRAVCAECGADAVYWTRRYEPAARARDAAVAAALAGDGSECREFGGSLLYEPDEVATQAEQRPYVVFAPYWRACAELGEPAPPLPVPRLAPVERWPAMVALAHLGLLPTVAWDAGLRAAWRPGLAGWRGDWKHFARRCLRDYAEDRDRPDYDGTSRLSPHLHFGEVSPRQVWHDVCEASELHFAAHVDPFLRQLGWREFAHHVLWHFPHTAAHPLRERFADFPWEDNQAALRAWQRGATGHPLVDAAMRQLWETGWMHNRLRMVVASFLTKHLLVPWQAGAAWFQDTLVDADLANNTLGWQWTAGCGADAAPYYRIFNPVKQAADYDPDGAFLASWLPELAGLPLARRAAPWTATPAELARAGVQLGQTYPLPLVDHAAARTRALAAYETIRRHVV